MTNYQQIDMEELATKLTVESDNTEYVVENNYNGEPQIYMYDRETGEYLSDYYV